MAEITESDPVAAFRDHYFHTLRRGGSIRLDDWSKAGDDVVRELDEATRNASSVNDLQNIAKRWRMLDEFLKYLTYMDNDVHFPGFVEHACTTWWDAMTYAQLRLECTVGQAYRAMPAYILAMLAFRQRDRGAALRWASLGYIADMLQNGGQKAHGWGTDLALRHGLGASPEIMDLLDRESRTEAKHLVEDLPEWRLTNAISRPQGLALVAPSMRYSHHASVPYVKAAVAHAFEDKPASPEDKGYRLERLTAFLVTTVPGMRPRLRLKMREQSAEHDVVAASVGDSPYPLPERASEWLIECKNWDKRANVQVVGHFLAKMLRAGAKFGILIAREGITRGETEDKFAEAFRSDFCLRHRVFCLVISADELRALGDRGTFRGLIDSKYELERFGASLFEASTDGSIASGDDAGRKEE